jgi:hypothetical protein
MYQFLTSLQLEVRSPHSPPLHSIHSPGILNSVRIISLKAKLCVWLWESEVPMKGEKTAGWDSACRWTLGMFSPSEMMCQPLAATLHTMSSRDRWLIVTVISGNINNHSYICTVNFHLRKRLQHTISLFLVCAALLQNLFGFSIPQRNSLLSSFWTGNHPGKMETARPQEGRP